VGIADQKIYSNSMFAVLNSHPVTLLIPAVTVDLTAIVQVEYFIEDPATTTTALPPVAYTNSLITTDATLATDGRLAVQYEIRLVSTSTVPAWITSYSQATRLATIYATDNNLDG